MDNAIIHIDDEEVRPLSRQHSSSSSDSSLGKKTFSSGRSKLLHFLVGISICGGIVVFFPSWIIQPNDLSVGTSRIKNLRKPSSQSTSYYEGEDFDALIPKCAKSTFLTLYDQPSQTGEEEDGKVMNGNLCRGMLLRDDIILTSHECSQSTLFFESNDGTFVKATPHSALNANMGLHSKLGFLEAKDVPFHYIFLDRPVRRARMFLSLRSHPEIAAVADDDDFNQGDESSESNPSFISPYITCHGYRPIAHNFPLSNGEMVPIGEELLAVGMPEDLLWEHDDLDTAPALRNENKERWWAKAITFEEGMGLFEEHFAIPEIKGPEGSVSIVRAHEGFIGRASGLSEAFDPRGHRRDMCFHNYVARWREQKPFSGMHFFDWLDYGTGRSLFERDRKYHFLPDLSDDMVGQLDDKDCVKEKFNSKTVHYFNDEERAEHEIYLSPSGNGTEVVARYKQSDELVGPSSADHNHLYMFDLEKRMYIVDKNLWDKAKYGRIKHTAVLAGSPALSAGEAYFLENGVVGGINYSSGHYRPKISAVTMMYQWVKDQGLNTAAFNWVGRKQWSTKDCFETDWNGFEIHVFDTRVLEETCREVLKSPTWTYKKD